MELDFRQTNIGISNWHGYQWIIFMEDITIENCHQVDEEICYYLAQNNKNVVFDLAYINFINSTAIGLLIRMHNMLKKQQRTSCIVNCTEEVRDIFERIRLDKVFTIYANDDEFAFSQEKEVLE